MTKDKEIIKKQDELIEHFKAYYDAQNSPAVKLIEPQWYNYLNQLESELSSLKAEAENIKIIKEILPHTFPSKAEAKVSDPAIQLKPYFDDEITSCPTCGCEIPKGEKCDLDTCKEAEAKKEEDESFIVCDCDRPEIEDNNLCKRCGGYDRNGF